MNILKFDITAKSWRASTTSGQEQEVPALFFSLVINDVKLTDKTVSDSRFQSLNLILSSTSITNLSLIDI